MDLSEALAQVGRDLGPAQDPWWIIGSAAMALHGVQGLRVGDIDILASPRDARLVLARNNAAAAPGSASPRFRSEVHGSWHSGDWRVEVMAGFAVRQDDRWVPVCPLSRLAAGPVFIPAVAELIAMCRLFGRPKDDARRKLLEALAASA